MVISVDKFTAVKMYDKVSYYWKEEIKKLNAQIIKTKDAAEKLRLKRSCGLYAQSGNGCCHQ